MSNAYAEIEDGVSTYRIDQERLRDEHVFSQQPAAFQLEDDDCGDPPEEWIVGQVLFLALAGDKNGRKRTRWARVGQAPSPYDYEDGVVILLARQRADRDSPLNSMLTIRWRDHGESTTCSCSGETRRLDKMPAITYVGEPD